MVFVKGQSGNPAGRPKGRFSLTTLITKQLEDNPDQTKEIINWLLKNKKDLVWQMIDSRPPLKGDLNVNLPQSLIGLFIHAKDNPSGYIDVPEQLEE